MCFSPFGPTQFLRFAISGSRGDWGPRMWSVSPSLSCVGSPPIRKAHQLHFTNNIYYSTMFLKKRMWTTRSVPSRASPLGFRVASTTVATCSVTRGRELRNPKSWGVGRLAIPSCLRRGSAEEFGVDVLGGFDPGGDETTIVLRGECRLHRRKPVRLVGCKNKKPIQWIGWLMTVLPIGYFLCRKGCGV